MDSAIMPLFVFDDTDLIIYTSAEGLIECVEEQDVARGEYHGFDAEGFEIHLSVAGEGTKSHVTLRRGNNNAAQFQEELQARLQKSGELVDDHCNLRDLQERALTKYELI
jgi:hypothetical protein